MNRREWLYLGATVGSTVALATILNALPRGRKRGLAQSGLVRGSGPLALPPGFSQTILSETGVVMSDGLRTPALPDGMACFQAREGHWILTRNHELSRTPLLGAFPSGHSPLAFDPACHGGVSRLVLEPTNLHVLSSNLVLTGTDRNCSSGPSPWGFLTCEESEDDGHGWVFLCDPGAASLREPKPIAGYGRFRHEAVAIDPTTLCAYLTEDQKDGALYRFVPSSYADPFEGRLEAARVLGIPRFDTGRHMGPGSAVDLEWVEVPNPRAERQPTRKQLREHGALIVQRGEGIWFDAGTIESGPSVVIAATTGGPSGNGQIFRLVLGRESRPDRLELLAQAPTTGGLQFPDNITVAPWGEPIIAEDGNGPQHLRGIRADGTSYAIARNIASNSEFAGVCFSPDGSTLFCNLQTDGLTLAIRGPWHETASLPSS